MLGLMMNVPVLEASEDIREAKLIGATMGGATGVDYLEHLADTALPYDPDKAYEIKIQMAVADDSRGIAHNEPPQPQDDSPDIGTPGLG